MTFFRKTFYKKKKKHPFLLVEVIISILLISMVGFTFFEMEKKIAKKIREFVVKTECERKEEEALATLLEKLSMKDILADAIERKRTLTFKLKDPWSADFHFMIEKPEDKPGQKIFLVKVDITLSHPYLEVQKPPFSYYFCWNKDNVATETVNIDEIVDKDQDEEDEEQKNLDD